MLLFSFGKSVYLDRTDTIVWLALCLPLNRVGSGPARCRPSRAAAATLPLVCVISSLSIPSPGAPNVRLGPQRRGCRSSTSFRLGCVLRVLSRGCGDRLCTRCLKPVGGFRSSALRWLLRFPRSGPRMLGTGYPGIPPRHSRFRSSLVRVACSAQHPILYCYYHCSVPSVTSLFA